MKDHDPTCVGKGKFKQKKVAPDVEVDVDVEELGQGRGNVIQTRYSALGASGDTMKIPMKIKLANI